MDPIFSNKNALTEIKPYVWSLRGVHWITPFTSTCCTSSYYAENVKPSMMWPTPADVNLGPISVCLVNKHSACQLTRHSAAAAAPAAMASAVRWRGLIVTHCRRMKCHHAAAVIPFDLGLYLTAHALTVRDRGFTSLHMSTRMMMIIWLDRSLIYCCRKWSGH